MSKAIKIGIHNMSSGTGWQAGRVYVDSLLHGLRQEYKDEINIALLTPRAEKQSVHELGKLANEVIAYPSSRIWSPRWVAKRGVRRLLRRDLTEEFLLNRHGVDVVAFWDLFLKRVPTLAWLADFQHVHLPEMFSARARRRRDQQFLRLARSAGRVILLSDAVKRDFQVFAPQYVDKTRVLRPVSYVPPSVFAQDPPAVIGKYNLPDKFIYLPGQFWQHKNHATAFQALKILKDKGLKVSLVCSGHTIDYRRPDHFSNLMRGLEEAGLGAQVALVGLVPREDLFQLMRQSVCVLNPSLFEGFGMTVDEARSVGKPVLASDLPAHREQDLPQAFFFDPRDSEDLAKKMELIWREEKPGPDANKENAARQSFSERIGVFAKEFMSIVHEVVGKDARV